MIAVGVGLGDHVGAGEVDHLVGIRHPDGPVGPEMRRRGLGIDRHVQEEGVRAA